jgi:2-iminoacetate synthase ThiH
MSALVERAIADAGLAPALAARRAGLLGAPHLALLRAADLLALGALADLVRAEEVGDEVRIYVRDAEGDGAVCDEAFTIASVPFGPADASTFASVPFGPADAFTFPSAPFGGASGAGPQLTGLELLREVAVARVMGPRGARVRVDWSRCGLELAQVALGFGANELVGRIANKRGLPLAEGERLGVGKKSRHLPADEVKRRELAGFVQRAGRTPCFVPEVG